MVVFGQALMIVMVFAGALLLLYRLATALVAAEPCSCDVVGGAAMAMAVVGLGLMVWAAFYWRAVPFWGPTGAGRAVAAGLAAAAVAGVDAILEKKKRNQKKQEEGWDELRDGAERYPLCCDEGSEARHGEGDYASCTCDYGHRNPP